MARYHCREGCVLYMCLLSAVLFFIHPINLLILFKPNYLHLIQLYECCSDSVHIYFNVQSHIFFSPYPFAKNICVFAVFRRTEPCMILQNSTSVILMLSSFGSYCHIACIIFLKVQLLYPNTHSLLGSSTIPSLRHQWLRATVFISDTDNILTNIGRNRNADVMSRRCFDLDAITSYHYTIH